ncbi:hypothetical protein J3458_015142 [Metarhizium acridum]|uniref:uncharacterized protein n=1 Tax=Metarhizium acridum TaxID=92637 RepID=UPI001C6BEAA7|nr:hypothetical protein J3458_015142 [Metarhizium acridum]
MAAPPGTTAPRRRNNNIPDTYLELMKPDENWTNLQDSTERRKIQNRLAQRAYRRNMRDRAIEVKMLREELQRMREGASSNEQCQSIREDSAPSVQTHTSPVSSTSSEAKNTQCSPTITIAPKEDSAGVIDSQLLTPCTRLQEADWMGGYSEAWPESCDGADTLGDGPFQVPSTATGILGGSEVPTAMHVPTSASSKFPAARIGSVLPLVEPDVMQRPRMPVPSCPLCGSCPVVTTKGYVHTRAVDSPGRNARSFNVDKLVRQLAAGSSQPIPNAGEPLLHLAVAGGHIDMLQYLLENGNVSVDARDSAGYTPLQRAVMTGRTDMVALLLQAGSKRDEFGASMTSWRHVKGA